MLRNRAFTVLQKTYDDSYLSCSTAVYYESQGDELEAMRHWRKALDSIYEHHATKAVPRYGPQTDTEKALVDALEELELQCKERIDLLEALRVSRQDGSASASSPKPPKTPALLDSTSRPQGSIGQGTIPAVTYSELSRPLLPNRLPLPTRRSSENAVGSGGGSAPRVVDPSSSVSLMPPSPSPRLSPRQDKAALSPSLEKHTMRTTLRSARVGDKPSRPARKSPKPVAEGPSKAATLAWSALGSRERLPNLSASGPSTPTPPPRAFSDQLSKSQLQWDSHSRRLVTPRDVEPLSNGLRPVSTTRHSDEYSYSVPSLLSVSAASSALNSSSCQEPPFSDLPSTRSEQGLPPRIAPTASGLLSRSPRDEQPSGSRTADDSGDLAQKKSPSDAQVRRKVVAKRAAQATQSSGVARGQDRASRIRRREGPKPRQTSVSSTSEDDATKAASRPPRPAKRQEPAVENGSHIASSEETAGDESASDSAWKKQKAFILKNLPLGVDEAAAKQILNDIIVQGDEVRWGDIAGLDIAKNALREAVVYPFLRPDLFMGLREPARGMLLFGPPGTGKTMLARAVATESKSTFFSISASSLTSKYLGESEKLVKALFGLARALAPSIIFVDEIDSLLSQRSASGEHEATRRIKTEFLIQWSDLQRAAAGRETTERDKERGDANRVLVLAATNLPWAIDEAARRRFVRRQYIPLPEPHTRETQLRTLLGQQKHSLSSADIQKLVELTEGFSGSDVTALAKDAAMGPLRSLGEALLHMTMDEIRPITLIDFEASLGTIRPSVSKAGLQAYEDWAREFGERGG